MTADQTSNTKKSDGNADPKQNASEEKKRFTRRGGRLFRGIGGISRFFYVLIMVGVFIGAGLALGGFAKFTQTVRTYEAPQSLETYDGIVVLTGGSQRIAAGLELLRTNKAKRLLISGVNKDTSEKAILNLTDESASLFECCVDLDREAANTVGNATEAANWAKKHGFERLIIVTSDYHLPRSMLEMRRAMPKARLQPLGVSFDRLKQDGWYRDSEAMRLLVSEYTKYVGARLRPTLVGEPFATIRARVSAL
ncbi:MAG: YdcF family protein [Pseudomonadota bacterium]